eukprot:g1977.t1
MCGLILLEISESQRDEALTNIVRSFHEQNFAIYPPIPDIDSVSITMSFLEENERFMGGRAADECECCKLCVKDIVQFDHKFDGEEIVDNGGDMVYLETDENIVNLDVVRDTALIEFTGPSQKQKEAAPERLGKHICCNICQDGYCAKKSSGIMVFLETTAGFVAKGDGYGQGGGKNRAEGGCCTLCGSKFYGARGWGAPPFSEPGNKMQNMGAGGFFKAEDVGSISGSPSP